jgi:hypothetical protein
MGLGVSKASVKKKLGTLSPEVKEQWFGTDPS